MDRKIGLPGRSKRTGQAEGREIFLHFTTAPEHHMWLGRISLLSSVDLRPNTTGSVSGKCGIPDPVILVKSLP